MSARQRHIVSRYLVVLGALALAFALLYAAFISVLLTVQPGDAGRHAEVRSYLLSPIFTGNPPAFLEEQEASHMRDVKRLLDAAFVLDVLCLGALIGLGAALRRWREEWLARVFWAGGWTAAGISAFLLLSALLGFERLFLIFHMLLFPQGNWLFPADSALIQLYPQAFFYRFAAFWLAGALLLGGLSVALGLLLDRMGRHEAAFKRHK